MVAMPLLFLVAAEEKSLAVLRSPLDLLADRSPGERDPGALFSTKPPRKAAAPSERVLATVRDRPLLPPPTEPLFETESLVPEEPVFVTELALLEPPLIVDSLPVPIVPPQLVQEPPEVPGGPVDPGAVPEPATWLTMIVGLFGIAAMIRRGNRGRMAATAEAVAPTC